MAPFEDLYRNASDPWGTRTRWYERRKRSLLLAALPAERYGSIYEAGCGTGHISVELAARCDTLLASDGSTAALAGASEVLADQANAEVARHTLPADWPQRRFDLIVLSEILYFVDEAACRTIAAAARRSAGDAGTVVACDWRAEIDGHGHSGDAVHRRFDAALNLPKVFEYIDDDFILTGWSADERSVAAREGSRP
ncbi:MAG: methyltransferase domain-containing protein [Burkholderiaceae bacterium]